MSIVLFLPEAPSANRYWRNFSGRTVKSKDARGYVGQVWAEARKKNVKPLKGDVEVTILWYRSRKVGDIDNRVKVLNDAMNGICFEDDKQIRRLSIERIDGVKPAGMHVTITAY